MRYRPTILLGRRASVSSTGDGVRQRRVTSTSGGPRVVTDQRNSAIETLRAVGNGTFRILAINVRHTERHKSRPSKDGASHGPNSEPVAPSRSIEPP